MSATIKVFYVGNQCFRHVMNSHRDQVELRNENDETLLTYSGTSKVFDRHGRVGSLIIEYVEGNPRWVYYGTQKDICIILSPDWASAEVEVSRRYIAGSWRN